MGQRINPVLFRLTVSRKWKNTTFQHRYSLSPSLKIRQFLNNLKWPLEIQGISYNSILHSGNVICHSLLPVPLTKKAQWEHQLALLTGLKAVILEIQPSLKPLPLYHPNLLLQLLLKEKDLPSILHLFPNSRIQGIKIQLKGRIKGILKAKTVTYTRGSLPLQQLKAKIEYHSHPVQTPHGILGTKIWICYNPFR